MKKLTIGLSICTILALGACKGTSSANNADSGNTAPSDTGAGVRPMDTTGLGTNNKDTLKMPKQDTIPGGNASGSGGSVKPKH